MRDQIVSELEDAMRVVGNLHALVTNYINSDSVFVKGDHRIDCAEVTAQMDRSIGIIQKALEKAVNEIKSLPDKAK